VSLLKKRIISFLLAFGIASSYAVPVFANPSEAELNNQLNEQRSELNENKKSLQEVREKLEDIESEIQLMDSDIEEAMRAINDTKKRIESTQLDIKAAQDAIKAAEEDMAAEKELFDQRMRAMYINGFDGYLSIILESKGFGDFLSRVDDIKRIIEADKEVIAELEAKKGEVEKKKQDLIVQNEKLIALKADNEKRLVKLKEDKTKQAEKIKELREQENKFAAEMAEERKKINETMELIKKIRDSAPKYTPSRGAAAYSSDAVVAYAANFLGTPYVWGGSSPQPGFDCSGFTSYVYRHFGVSLPRVSAAQATVGTTVASSDLQPGDLVFFKKPGRQIHHVGIYVGNGAYIHSPQTGEVVKISILSSRRDFYTARRVR
jgi:peptidoglycan hydrolase CwlO-like protein